MNAETFTDEQKLYLEGFVAGAGIRKSLALPILDNSTGGPDAAARAAQDRFVAEGKKLVAEEQAKRVKNGLDIWDEVMAHARDGRFPKGTDVFLFKFQGMFYVAPAQDSFMCRLRFPAGIVSSHQMRGLADLSQDFAGGYADVTTRANLQLREIGPRNTINVLMGLADLGIINKGAGADNIRNITASPLAGIDPHELLDTRPHARLMNHTILNHRELYGLPRKFNIAFDGGGKISALEDTNDIGFTAVRVGEGKSVPAGIYYRFTLGGITGHQDFARDTGLMVKPEDAVDVAVSAVRIFIEHGDRTDRKKARLKYVLDRMGLDGFVSHMKDVADRLIKFPIEECDPRPEIDKHGHVGIHPQRQPGFHYIGVVLPVGRLSARQLRGLANLADKYGSGAIRLTVWQNLILTDIPTASLEAVKAEIEALGLHHSATNIRGGLVACTGSAGCKYAAANTKKHAMEIAQYVESRLALDQPVNIHLTGCHHSCAQHYIGDIGLIATKVAAGDDMLEGYHVFVGGGYGATQGIARELWRDVLATDAPAAVERILRAYLDHRNGAESFIEFIKRHDIEQLKNLTEHHALAA